MRNDWKIYAVVGPAAVIAGWLAWKYPFEVMLFMIFVVAIPVLWKQWSDSRRKKRDKLQGLPISDEMSDQFDIQAGHISNQMSMIVWMVLTICQVFWDAALMFFSIGLLFQGSVTIVAKVWLLREGGTDAK